MERAVEIVDSIIWSNALIVILLTVGLYFSIRTGFMQVRLLKTMVRLLLKGKSSKEGVSSFQAFSMALAGRIGIGNIVGVATAISLGGPGALFWMWVTAFIGAATSYVECTLGQIYKEVKDGEYRGGPAFYIQKGLGSKGFALVFALAMLISAAVLLPGIQANSIAEAMDHAFSIKPVYSGLAIAVLVGVVIFGGMHRIGKTAEILVPFMALGYVIMAMAIMVINYQEIPAVFSLVVNSALGGGATFGGIIGAAIAWGVKRGLYSNEAGEGSAPQAASAAEVRHPAEQGIVQAFSVYIDTLIVCTATGFMILFSGMYNVADPAGGFLVENLPGVEAGVGYTQDAVNQYFPGFGTGFVAIALLFFAFTTILNYYFMAETNLTFLFKDNMKKWILHSFRLVLLLILFYGSIKSAGFVWSLGDIGVGLTAWINLIAIFLLRKPALKALKDYERQRREGKDPVFRPKELGIKNTEVWKD